MNRYLSKEEKLILSIAIIIIEVGVLYSIYLDICLINWDFLNNEINLELLYYNNNFLLFNIVFITTLSILLVLLNNWENNYINIEILEETENL